MLRVLVAATAAYLLAGCSIVPLPEDVSGGVDTEEIVKRIRCEARDAVRSYLRGAIALRAENRAYDQRLLERLLHPGTKAVLDLYENTAMAFDFDFNIAEINNLSGGFGLLQPTGFGPATLSANASFDRTRRNVRRFRVADTFATLALRLDDEYCAVPPRAPNFVYPIVGEIGILEQVGTFANLHRFNNLSAEKPNGPRAMSTTVTFTTKFSGTVNPSIKLDAIPRVLQVASATATAEATREDVHQALVVIALAADGASLDLAGRIVRVPTSAVQNANLEADRQIYFRGTPADNQFDRAATKINRCLQTGICN